MGNSCVLDNGGSGTECVSGQTQEENCYIQYGIGERDRTCNNGYWTSWSSCSVTDCNTGYSISGNGCVEDTPSGEPCTSSQTRSCTISHGTGQQTRQCINGYYASWGTCYVLTCNTGYIKNSAGTACVLGGSNGGETPIPEPTGTVYYCSSDSNCPSGMYCLEQGGVCLLTVPGNTYFVSPNGNDNNPGTFNSPWYSWQKGAEAVHAGDIVYIRGGVWDPAYTYSQNFIEIIGKSGTEANPIRIFNYPGERPIIDGINMVDNGYDYPCGIYLASSEYWHLKGLTVRNILQRRAGVLAQGISCGACANMIYENMVVHDVEGRAYQHWSGAYYPEGPPVPFADNTPFDSDTTYWINCDAYNLYDRWGWTDSPGNTADGWKVETIYHGTYYWIGCRAWSYSDDGFDPHGVGYRHFENCWTMSTGEENFPGAWSGLEGNGFKVVGMYPEYTPDYALGNHYGSFKNCIAADNIYTGFYNDLGVNGHGANGAVFYNNLAYANGRGMTSAGGNIIKNNIVYQNSQSFSSSATVMDHNSWNSGVSVSAADFVSLDTTELMAPRKADGSLPDINFGHLAQGSDLIDAGTVIPGYHCSTSGAHPGQNCVEWYGSAPDLGPFESNY